MMHQLFSLSLTCAVPIRTPITANAMYIRTRITANAMDSYSKRMLIRKSTREKNDDAAIKTGFVSAGDDDCRRKSRSKNPRIDAGAGSENQRWKRPRKLKEILEKLFDYLNNAAACLILFVLFKDWMRSIGTGSFRDNLRRILTETSYLEDESNMANREILRMLSQKFAESSKKSLPRRSGVRAPKLAIIYAKEDGQAQPLWNQFGYQPYDLVYESADHVDWSIFMKKPFCSIPLVWFIEEDKLGKRLPMYAEMGWERPITEWRRAFSRAGVVVFPDFSLPMLYSTLDTGIFIVSRSPVDVSEINQPDLLVLVIGSTFFYNTVTMRDLRPLVKNEVRGIIFQAHNPDSLVRSFSLLAPDMELSDLALSVAHNGKLLARNKLSLDCITGYTKLLENLRQFPSDTMLPGSFSPLQLPSWGRNLYRRRQSRSGVFSGFERDSTPLTKPNVLIALEGELAGTNNMGNTSGNEIEILKQESLTEQDWDDLRKMEIAEEFERREMQEINQRAEKTSGSWISIRGDPHNDKNMKFETNERDEGILPRIGQPLCISEIYDGAGARPFLHNGSLYRGLSLSTRERRSASDDLDAVDWLSLLNDTYNRDRLRELGGMYLIAKQVDNIPRIPLIGFQPWHARKNPLITSTLTTCSEPFPSTTMQNTVESEEGNQAPQAHPNKMMLKP